MKPNQVLLTLAAATALLAPPATRADVTNVTVSTLATVRDGANFNVDINEAAQGYAMVKYGSGSAAKSYFSFDLAGTLPNTNATAKFTLTKYSNSGSQHVQLWGLNQTYAGFSSAIIWATAQANQTNGNAMLTDPTNTYTATLVADAVVPTTATYEFTLPGGPGGWGRFIIADKLVLVLTGTNDPTYNNANGLRITLAQPPVLSFSTTAGNQPPSISSFTNLSLYQGEVSAQIPFTVGDDLDTPDMIYVWATSDKSAVVDPATQIEFSPYPYGSNRWLKVTGGPVVGSAKITVHAQDIYALENTSSFTVTVLPDPVISAIAQASTLINTPSDPVPFTIGSVDTPPAGLSVVGVSSNPAIVPNNGINCSTAGTNRTAIITPATDATGVVPITLWVTDGINSNSTAFGFMVLPSEDAVFCEHFAYADGNLNPLSANFWSLRGSGTTRLQVTNQQALIRSASSAESLLAPLAHGPIAVGSRAVIYTSFKATWLTVPGSSTGPFLHLNDGTASTLLAKIYTRTNALVEGTFRLGIASFGGTPADLPTELTTNVTYTIVSRYDVDAVSSALWVDAATESAPHASIKEAVAPLPVLNVGLRQNTFMGSILLDDLKLTTVTRPAVTGLSVHTGTVTINFAAGATDAPADFAVEGAAVVSEVFTPASAVITALGGGNFQATLPVAGAENFYRVKRQPMNF